MLNSFLIKLKANSDEMIEDVAKGAFNELNHMLETVGSRNFTYDWKNNFMPSFTVSNFLGHRRTKLEVQKGRYYFFRITTLHKEVFGIFSSIFFRKKLLKKDIHIENAKFQVLDMICSKEKSKWAGSLSFEQMDHILKGMKIENRLKMICVTPVIFKVGSRFYGDIDTELLFRDLMKKFNFHHYYQIDKNFVKDFSHIYLEKKNVLPRKVQLGKYFTNGFTGEIYMDLGKLEDKVKRIIYLLYKFAFFSGVGYQSPYGFGQVLTDESHHFSCNS